MGYIDQSKKSRIAQALKQVMPTGWKYGLSISAAPFELIKCMTGSQWMNPETATEATVNNHHVRECFADECVADTFEAIVACMNLENHDNSDSMTDYFDVGHYLHISIGRWNKPFVCTATPLAIAA